MINILKLFIPNFLKRLARNYDIIGRFQNFFSQYNLVYAQNHTIEIFEDTKISPLAIDKIYEQETTLFFRNYLRSGDTVFDVGANIGYFSLEFARLVGNSGKVVSFEPHPQIFKVLSRNITRNNYQNVSLKNVACGQKTGTVQLFLSGQNEGNHKIIDSPNNKGAVDVPLIRLNDYIREKMPRIIKMDIEGAELIALKGIDSELLNINNIDFVIEYHPYEMAFFKIEGKELLDFLSDYGYYFYDLACPEIQLKSYNEIDNQYQKGHFGITNLYCTKSKR